MSKLRQLKQQAYQAAKKRDWATAVSIYQEILELDKNNPTLINELGDLCLKANDIPRAIKHFLNAAAKYRATGLLNNAVAIYKKILRFDAENLNAHWYLAETRAGQGLTVEGQEHGLLFLENSEKVSGDIKEIFLKRCVQLIELYPESMPILEHLLQVFRMWDMQLETARVRCLLACQVWLAGDEDAARQAIAEATTKVPEICNYGEYARWLKTIGEATQAPAAGPTEFGNVNLEAANEPAAAPTPTQAPEPTPAAQAPAAGDPGAPSPVAPTPPNQAAAEPAASPASSPTADWGNLTLSDDAPAATPAAPAEPVAPAAAADVPAAPAVPDTADDAIDDAAADAAADAADDAADEKDSEGCFDIGDDADLSFDELLAQAAADVEVPAPAAEATPAAADDTAPAAGDKDHRDLLDAILSEESTTVTDGTDQLETITKEIGAQVGGQSGEQDPGSLYEMGMVYLEMGLFDQACDSFRQAADDAEFAVRAMEMWGITLQRDHRAEEAIAILSRALESTATGSRERLGIMYHLAQANELAERRDDAVKLYEQIHDQDRTYLDVGRRLAELAAV